VKPVLLSTREMSLDDIVVELKRPYSLAPFIERVRPVVEAVASEGYEAACRFSRRFDGVCYDDPVVSREEMRRAYEELPSALREAIDYAASRIEEYHRATLPPARVEAAPGLELTWRPVRRVGVYVPAGAKPYPSTALMTIIPARVAGVDEVVAATPPCRGDCRGFKADPVILAAMYRAGASKAVALGGAQAVAALAYGASPVPRVDMVAGPGGPYVTAAKALVAGVVGVDMLAGPSEIMVVAGPDTDPVDAALDTLAQAEHGALSTGVLVSWSRNLLERAAELAAPYAERVGRVYMVEVRGVDEAVELVDRYAPEHLELLGEAAAIEPRVRNTGAVSVGHPVAVMDYAAGPSHVLPTTGSARWRGGLSVYDFLKPVAVVRGVPREAYAAAYRLASYEGFTLHAKSIGRRMEKWRA